MTPALLAFIMSSLQVVQLLAKEVGPAVELLRGLQESLALFQKEGRDPTAEEWAALNTRIAAALSELGRQASMV